MIKKFRSILPILLVALTFPLCAEKEVEVPLPIWKMPLVWPRHCELRDQMIRAIRVGDIQAMEKACREGVRLMPGDPTWHYNLACALAYRKEPDLALTELEKAIVFGFRNAEAIRNDRDLQRISKYPRFAELVKKAESLSKQPVAGRPVVMPLGVTAVVMPLGVTAGGVAVLTETNVIWNFDASCFEGHIKINPSKKSLFELANTFGISQGGTSPERPYVAAYLSEGSASGNFGDVYINRDNNHSRIKISDFPHLTEVKFCKAATDLGIGYDLPNIAIPGAAVFGNASRARMGTFWRSIPRMAMTEPGCAARMDSFYLNNQFWVFPTHNDFGKPELGDVFPAMLPSCLATVGSSWSDLPYLRAALAASASFSPSVKSWILKNRLMAPTIQWLIRKSIPGVKTEEDYFSSKAHPIAFAKEHLDAKSIVKKAHELKIDEVPSVPLIQAVNSRMFPIKFPQPIVDYPDFASEVLYSTSTAIAFVLRGRDAKRTFLFRAQPFPAADPSAIYEWRVVGGDPSFVKIEAPLGERQGPSVGIAQITIDRTKLKGRIDIAVFVKVGKSDFGAPSFISFYAPPTESREYSQDGKLLSVDYTNPQMVYCDPFVWLPRNWKDVYLYDKDGKFNGYDRMINSKRVSSFTKSGERIISRKADSSPEKTVPVRYIPRNSGVPNMPPELMYMDVE
jgi:hypothetical protein